MSDLVARTARYIAIPSVSGDEAAIADEIEATLRAASHLEVTRLGDNIVARTASERRHRVVVAGHIDTVPGDPSRARVDEGVVTGLGACDMKGSIAVMVELALAQDTYASELTWVFYAREEIAREHSGLLEVSRKAPGLLRGDVALLCEPTGCRVEAGCQGTARIRLTLRGVRAHTARPWRGRNAIHRLVGPLEAAAGYVPRQAVVDGVTYTEQLQVVGIEGGVSSNVVPDVAQLTINHRVAPDRTIDEALDALHGLFDRFIEDPDDFEVMDSASPAPPSLTDPTIARLISLSGEAPRAKLGYTDVSTFSSFGVPAVNFGAGDPELAHHPDECVSAEQLDRCFSVLSALLDTSSAG